MKKLLVVAVAAFAAALAVQSVPAFAGGCCGGSAAKNACGFECNNQCPLAQDANTLRSMGRESLGVSTSLRASMSSMVQRNLSRV